MRIKVGDLVEVFGSQSIIGLVTEVTNPQYGLPPVYWIKFIKDGEEYCVQHNDIVRLTR